MAGAIWRRDELKTVSRYLVPTGVAAGLLAAVPGIIDYRDSVPPREFSQGTGDASTRSSTPPRSRCSRRDGCWAGDRAAPRCRSRCRRWAPRRSPSAAGWAARWRTATRSASIIAMRTRANGRKRRASSHRRSRALTSAAAPLGVNQMKLVHVDDERIVVARTERGLRRLPGSLHAQGRTAVGRRADLRHRAVPVARLAVRRRDR